MDSPRNDVFDTPLCIIKRHKGRGRYELYIHNEPLRSYLKEHTFQVVDEDLKEVKPFKKKMLFKELNYGKILAVVLESIDRLRSEVSDRDSKIQTWLEELTAQATTMLSKFSIEDFETESEYLNSCYLELLRELQRD